MTKEGREGYKCKIIQINHAMQLSDFWRLKKEVEERMFSCEVC
jgi:hypothetical protein